MIKKLTFLLVLTFFSISLSAQDAPTYLTAIEGDEEVTLFWELPDADFSGDIVGDPILIDEIPFHAVGSTIDFNNDYDEECPFSGSTAPDVVYSFTPGTNIIVDISLCDTLTAYDTKVYVYENEVGNIPSTTLSEPACNDDECNNPTTSFLSLIESLELVAGNTYYIIVDGYGSSSGNYELWVTENNGRAIYQSCTENKELVGESTELENVNKYEIYGTTEPFHEPVPSIVNPDYAQNSRSLDVIIECDGGSWQLEVSWEILDESGTIVASGGSPYIGAASLDNGVYTVNGYDSYGDGWNGNYLSVTNAANDEVYLNWTFADGDFGTTTFEIDDTVVAGDLIGYNAYVDGSQHNTDLIQSRNYSIDGLTNNTMYELGVTAVYYVNENETEESEPVTISATPTYLYGDITGVVTDPNGAPLDSVVVSSGNVSDTTDGDGVYTLWNLNTGPQTVTLSRLGFYSVTIDTTVLAQAEPTVLDIVLSPDMKVPHDLTAKALDEQVYLEWYTPAYGGSSVASLQGTWSIVGDWFCDGAGTFTSDFTFNDDGTFSYPDYYGQPTYGGTWGVEPGTVELIAGVCDAVTFEFNAWVIFDYYLTTYYIMHDGEEGIGVMDSGGDGSNDGDLLSTRVSESTNEFTVHALHYDENSLQILGEAPDNISEFSWVTDNDLLNREELLLEYRVYQVDTDGLETFVVATEDTFATVTASPNYLEYCYNVSAYWATDDYGELESRHSNVACTVPYTLGDADFDSEVTINDVVEVVDYILEEDVPTEDQFRNCDVNSDQEINIADVVMMVDIIFGGTGRVVGFDAGEIAYIDLKTDFEKSLLTFEIEYNSPVRGIEFELKFDPTLVNVMPPSMFNFQENVMMSYTEKEPGLLKVLAADLQGGHIEATDNSYMSIPVEFMGNERANSFVNLDGIKLAGADGSLINTVARTNSSEVKVIPGAFVLHQNFPNPFNPSTEIRFDLPEAGNVSLAIYNLMGQKIRTLSSDNMTPGYHAIIWDGTNDIRSQVATGMYFYSIQSNEFQATKKMLFLK